MDDKTSIGQIFCETTQTTSGLGNAEMLFHLTFIDAHTPQTCMIQQRRYRFVIIYQLYEELNVTEICDFAINYYSRK